VSSCSAANSR